MALISPGVQVSVTDESFSTGAGPGTVPLVFIATKQDKTTPDGTATAVGTTAANANNLYLISSQRELLQTFGNPDFNEVGGSAQNGYPLNEYGLLAAYSYLGVANRAYVIRADIDLSELDPLTTAPAGAPADGTYWVDLNNFVPGIFQYLGGEWTQRTVTTVVQAGTTAWDTSANLAGYQVGDIIAVWYQAGPRSTAPISHLEYFVLNSTATAWEKIDATSLTSGFEVYWGNNAQVPSTPAANAYWIKTNEFNNGLDINLKRYSSSLGQFVDLGTVPIYNLPQTYYSSVGGATSIAADTVIGIVDSNNSTVNISGAELDVTLKTHNGNSTLVVTAESAFTSTVTGNAITIQVGQRPVRTVLIDDTQDAEGNGANGGATLLDTIITDINSNTDIAADGLVVASKDSSGSNLVLTVLNGEDLTLNDSVGGSLNSIGFDVSGGLPLVYSNFSTIAASYEASATQPTGSTPYGTYWYDPSFTVDLMIKNASGSWFDIAAADFFVQADEPTSNSANSIWVETDTGTAYPVIYRRNTGDTAWVQVDNTDQTSPLGIVFADARDELNVPATKTAIAAADLDSDAPDPALYPAGMLLWNSRASGRNVKVWTQNAVDAAVNLATTRDRWVSASGNANDGSLITGAAAQKQVVIEALASTLTSNEDVRNDTIFYNLIAAPGFPELMDEMLALNVDRKEQAFVIGDSPFSLSSSSTALQAWASNSNNAAGNGDDGLVSADPYLGVYYPSGLSTNVDGSEVVVPASHMVLRQMAYNDQVAYPWFAPAGFSRGTISNATAVGYLDSEDEFVTVTLNEGQRDTLYNNNVNAIATLPGRGIVIWGQKTRNATAGALDRVNVARLVNYIRFQADQLAQPFLFEPNDGTTRDAVKEAFDSFLAELVTLRGVTDFLVVVDESNNTPARIDRNELWVDIAIQPTKAVEFIYIPIRLRNTGSDLQPGA
jgi:hypothetical protein